MSIPTKFDARGDQDVEPDVDVEPGSLPLAMVDASRTVSKGDLDAQDAIWVCMIGGSGDDVSGPESRQTAIKYVSTNYSSNGPSIDKTFGPMVDDGTVQAPRGLGNMSGAPMSAGEYLRMAAVQNVSQKTSGRRQYCYFVRVRRNTGL